MPKAKSVPAYRRHKARNCAVVTIHGRNFYLGPFNSPESREVYARLIAEHFGTSQPDSAPSSSFIVGRSVTITELIATYYDHVRGYYRRADGSPTDEVSNIRLALRPVRELYGSTLAAEFGPLRLQAVRQSLIDGRPPAAPGDNGRRPWCRTSVNRAVARIKQLFKWGVAQELVPAGVFHGLQSVAGLRLGRSGARESDPVKPVPQAFVTAVLSIVRPHVAAMIRLQQLTGARPGEIIAMRGRDLDVSGKVWAYRPTMHKTAHRGHRREIFIGPAGQDVVRPYLKTDLQAYLFSPREAEALRDAERVAKRRPSTPKRVRTCKANPQRAPRDHYSVHSYCRAIARACIKAGVPAWHPHQLRHSRATELRRDHGVELARIVLGHATAFTTEIYAEADRQQAVEVMGQIG
ncbi:MAG: site-specific integrase [Planctomycetia bacterium]|nr:site-specific integrase [Planctomycetia bacterium]